MSAPHQAKHLPVMLAEVIAALGPKDGGHYIDGTFGGGGYARAILEAADCKVLGIDRDPEAIARGQALVRQFEGRLTLVEGEFSRMDALAGSSDGIVLDLGVSSFQFDTPARGFSFREDGPLDMRMSLSGPSAADFVNSADHQHPGLGDRPAGRGEKRPPHRQPHHRRPSAHLAPRNWRIWSPRRKAPPRCAMPSIPPPAPSRPCAFM